MNAEVNNNVPPNFRDARAWNQGNASGVHLEAPPKFYRMS